MTNEQRLIEKQKELISLIGRKYMFQNLREEISELESELVKEEPEGVTAETTKQLSGLSDYELELEKVLDKIKSTENILECIGILRQVIKSYKQIDLGCKSCGKPLSGYCDRCKHLWES